MSQTYRIDDLLTLMEKLRDPEQGCNWDKKQTLASLTAYTLEEVYEVIDAVETGDDAQLQDELGDLLFQIVFYTQIVREEGRFDFNAIVTAVTEKLLRRHPHVFPDGTLESFGDPALQGIDAQEVAARWELIKNEERARKAARSAAAQPPSVLEDIPASLPALDRARKLQKRAATVGFDWQQAMPVLQKLREEIDELEVEMLAGASKRVVEEFGDLMFSCVNLARHLQVDPETALRAANRKFEQRFRAMESIAAEEGLVLNAMNESELETRWQRAKSVCSVKQGGK